MALLFEEDYKILHNSGLEYVEDEPNRFLIIKNFPLQPGLYIYNDLPVESAEVLIVVPPNYNTSGNDMLWVYPALKRANGELIPCVMEPGGGDARSYDSKEYCRWSRHYTPDSWSPKVDNIEKILSRIEWALKKPDTQK